MIDQLTGSLNLYEQAIGLRHERQQILTSNIANADTPGYKARDFDFANELQKAVDQGGTGNALALSRTSAQHIEGQVASTSSVDLAYRVSAQPSLDGNTVEMNRERAAFSDNSVRYQAAISMLDSRIQGLKSAMQPAR